LRAHIGRREKSIEGESRTSKLLSAVVCSLLLLTGSASATCLEANIAGFWKLYAASSSGNGVAWYKCSLYMKTTGAITSASSCQNYFSQSTPVTGHVSLASGPNCTFVGSIHQTVLSGER
jgi:hypothetical protein